jgi:glycosyltransferase involved in cell wall biosynthesis
VDGLLAQASLVVLPYTQASQSGVGLLAVGAGVPVVVSNLGALPELVHDPTLIATAGDPADLAQAVVHHIDHGPEFRAGVLEHARASFSWSHVADSYRRALPGAHRRCRLMSGRGSRRSSEASARS